MGVHCDECGCKFSPGETDKPCAYCEVERLKAENAALRLRVDNDAPNHQANTWRIPRISRSR